MTDEYTKTVVIRDPDYRPGQVGPTAPANGPASDRSDADDNAPAKPTYPNFDDTSWLT